MSQMKAIVDLLLSNVSSIVQAQGCIGEEIFPEIKSVAYTGKLGKYGNSHLRVEKSLKGGRGSYRRVETITRSTSSFEIEGHGLEGIVTKSDYANVQLPFRAEEDETMGLTSTLLVEKEKTIADALSDTSIVTQNTTLSGTSQLSDYDNSNPIGVFSTARTAIRNGCGMVPNLAFMDYSVWNKLRYHPKLLDTLGYKYNRPGGLKEDELAVALDVDKILVAKAVYNSAKEGQTDSIVPIWGKHLFFGVLPETAQPYQVSGGYLVVPEGSTPRKVYKSPIFNPPGSTLILVEDEYDLFLSNIGALYLVKNAVA